MPIAQKQFETSFALSTKSLKLARALHILTWLRCQSTALQIKDVQTSTLFFFQGSVLCQPSYWQGTRKRAERYLIFKSCFVSPTHCCQLCFWKICALNSFFILTKQHWNILSSVYLDHDNDTEACMHHIVYWIIIKISDFVFNWNACQMVLLFFTFLFPYQ